MFRLAQSNSIVFSTPITVLDANGGQVKTSPRLIYKRLSATRRRALLEGARDGSETDASIAREVLMGWEEGQIVDEEGRNIESNPDNVTALLDVDGVDYWVSKGWFELTQQGRLGNSK